MSNAERLSNVVEDVPAKNVRVRDDRSGRWLAKA